MTKREATIQGFRELADFLEQHPDVPLPVCNSQNAFVDKEQIGQLARLTSWDKHFYGEWFALRKQFSGDVVLELNVPREKICRKVVTGTRMVEAQPAREVEEYEWVCDEPLLAQG